MQITRSALYRFQSAMHIAAWAQEQTPTAARNVLSTPTSATCELGKLLEPSGPRACYNQLLRLPHNISPPARRLTPEWLAAVAATLGVPASRCLVVASSGSVVRAAAEAGMVAVGMPRQGALAATYELAAAKFEGFGPGYATWPRLQALLKTGGGTRR